MSVRSLGCPKMESSSAQLEDKTKELEALVQQYPFETSLSKDVLNKIAQLVKNFIGEIEDLKTQHQKYRIYQFLKSKDWSWSVEKKGTDPRITHLVLSWTLKILEADVTSQQISTDRLFQMKPEKIDEANKALKELV